MCTVWPKNMNTANSGTEDVWSDWVESLFFTNCTMLFENCSLVKER